ncbi:MAG: hypothetical protein LBT56_02350 [Prevotellaceae bacterium]|jgi:hypothetical protein|nr:hypothetical protein [Prevotellaceae bacterium]
MKNKQIIKDDKKTRYGLSVGRNDNTKPIWQSVRTATHKSVVAIYGFCFCKYLFFFTCIIVSAINSIRFFLAFFPYKNIKNNGGLRAFATKEIFENNG